MLTASHASLPYKYSRKVIIRGHECHIPLLALSDTEANHAVISAMFIPLYRHFNVENCSYMHHLFVFLTSHSIIKVVQSVKFLFDQQEDDSVIISLSIIPQIFTELQLLQKFLSICSQTYTLLI